MNHHLPMQLYILVKLINHPCCFDYKKMTAAKCAVIFFAWLVLLPMPFRWYLFRNATGSVPGLACPSSGQYKEELRIISPPLASGSLSAALFVAMDSNHLPSNLYLYCYYMTSILFCAVQPY